MVCPCCSGKEYLECCKPYHEGQEVAPTAEALMRSRYSAFAHKQYDYLQETLDPQTRHTFDAQATSQWAESSIFTRLEIIKSEEIRNKGTVEFKAYYCQNDKDSVHHEISQFRQQGGVWYFRQGRVVSKNSGK